MFNKKSKIVPISRSEIQSNWTRTTTEHGVYMCSPCTTVGAESPPMNNVIDLHNAVDINGKRQSYRSKEEAEAAQAEFESRHPLFKFCVANSDNIFIALAIVLGLTIGTYTQL